MKQWIAGALMAGAWSVAGVAGAHTRPDSAVGLGARLTQSYIAPAMHDFHHAASHTREALQSACKTPDADTQQVEDAFTHLVSAWSGIEFLRFGPLVDANRFESIYFWPDPRGITTRQVQQLLAKPLNDIPNAAALAQHSVALQGLPALEYVLYRDGGLLSAQDEAPRASACAYAVAVAGNLERLGGELAAQWGENGDYARLFSNPGADNALYRNEQEIASEVIKALSTGLQFQVDIKLAPALGSGVDKANARRAPFWRSNLTTTSLRAAAGGMLAFYKAGGYQFAGAQWIDQNVRGELQRAIDQSAAMHGKAETLFKSEDGHRQFLLVKLLLGNAKDLVDQDVAPALGVRMGFNALDGD